jgi:hypothetical protein
VVSKRENGIFVSASALVDYLKCSQMSYYRIFEPEQKTSNREMIIGDIVHKTIEKAWQNLDVALNLGRTLADNQGVDAVGKQSVEHFIHTFFESFSQLVTREDKIEKFFKIKLEEDVYLVGKLDRLSRGMIFDWKTNSTVPKNIDSLPQFIIYDYAYRLTYNKPAEGIYFASLKTGGLIRYNESKEHSETLINKVIPNYIDDVRKKNFVKQGLFNGSCYRCPFKIPCLGERSSVVVFESTD